MRRGGLAEFGRMQLPRPFHRIEKARGGIRIIAGLRDRPDADLIGVEFLLAREARDRALLDGRHFLALFAALDHARGLGDHGGALFLFGAQHGVMGGDMADLMRHHRRHFGRIIGERQAGRASHRSCPAAARRH